MSVARHRELLVLGVLCSHELHGYALVDALASGLGRGLDIKRPTVYALLSRLEARGLVTHVTTRDSAYPERRVYRATRKGRKALAELVLSCTTAGVGATLPLAIVIAHLEQLPPEDRVSVLESCRDELEATLAGLTSLPAHDGLAGTALELVERHHRLDLETVRSLLAAACDRKD